MTIIILDKVDFRDITILNIYAPNNRASKYTKPKLIKMQGEIHKSNLWQRFQYLSLSEW